MGLEMTQGGGFLTNQTIAIAADGRAADGQHRLHAVSTPA